MSNTMEKREILTDSELCKKLRISVVTLRKYMQNGPPRKRFASTGDVRTIRHFTIGGQRRWLKQSVDEFIHGE